MSGMDHTMPADTADLRAPPLADEDAGASRA
jgi:hypothetical protein